MIIKEKKVKELNKVFSVLLSIAVPVIFVTAVIIRCGNTFESNDDLFISGILSGGLTGEVDFHTFFISNWITMPISLLYRMNASIPWWGLFLLAMIILSHAIIIYYSMRNKPERVVIVPLADLALSFAYIHMIGKMSDHGKGEKKRRNLVLCSGVSFLLYEKRRNVVNPATRSFDAFRNLFGGTGKNKNGILEGSDYLSDHYSARFSRKSNNGGKLKRVEGIQQLQ